MKFISPEGGFMKIKAFGLAALGVLLLVGGATAIMQPNVAEEGFLYTIIMVLGALFLYLGVDPLPRRAP